MHYFEQDDGWQDFLDRRVLGWRSFAADVKEFRRGDYFVAPLALDYSGDGRFLATVGEAGMMSIVDHGCFDRATLLDLGTGDAMTDVQWGPGSADRIVLASADNHAYVYDPCRVDAGPVACFSCGEEAVKSARWSGHLIAAGGRDGCIRLFDVRVASRNASLNHPVLQIDDAHALKRGGRRPECKPSIISALHFIPHHPQRYLCSIGQPDHNVHVWDCRFVRSSVPAEVVVNPTDNAACKRPRAFVDIAASPDGLFLTAVNSNGCIYKVSTANFQVERTFSHPSMRTWSFYVKCSVSPDCRWIACGSVGDSGAVWLYSSEGRAVYRLRHDPVDGEQHAECTGIAWRPQSCSLACSVDTGAICFWGDDGPVKEGTSFGGEPMNAGSGGECAPSLGTHPPLELATTVPQWPPLLPRHRSSQPSDSLQSLGKSPRTILDYFPLSAASPSPRPTTKRSIIY